MLNKKLLNHEPTVLQSKKRQEAEGQPAGGSPSWYISSCAKGMYLVHECVLNDSAWRES